MRARRIRSSSIAYPCPGRSSGPLGRFAPSLRDSAHPLPPALGARIGPRNGTAQCHHLYDSLLWNVEAAIRHVGATAFPCNRALTPELGSVVTRWPNTLPPLLSYSVPPRALAYCSRLTAQDCPVTESCPMTLRPFTSRLQWVAALPPPCRPGRAAIEMLSESSFGSFRSPTVRLSPPFVHLKE